jgi:hypothetical protein
MSPPNMSDGFLLCCSKGHLLFVKILLPYCTSFALPGATRACQYGHTTVLQHLIDSCSLTKESIVNSSSESLPFHVADYLEKKFPHVAKNKANSKLKSAVQAGNMLMVNSAISEGADDFDGALCTACVASNTSLIDKFLDLGAKDVSKALLTSCTSGSYVSAKHLLSLYNFPPEVIFKCYTAALSRNCVPLTEAFSKYVK